MRNHSGRRNGFSLIEVLVALGIVGIAAISFATLISQLMSAQRTSQARQDLITLTNEFQTMFSTRASCTSGLVPGFVFDPARAAALFPPASGPINGLPFQYRLNGDILADNVEMQTYLLRANKIQLVNAVNVGIDLSGNTIYKVQVIGQFSPKGQNVSGLKDFSNRILGNGYFAVSGNTIVSCSMESPEDINRVSQTCTSLGGTYDLLQRKCLMPVDLASICTGLQGSMSGGVCRMPASGGTGGSRWVVTGVGGVTSTSSYCPVLIFGGPCPTPGMECDQPISTGTSEVMYNYVRCM